MIRQSSLSRRSFIAGTGAAISLGATVGGRAATPAKAEFKYRLGLSQPLNSPNFIRLQEMAANVGTESNGRMVIEMHGAGALGSDRAMLAMLQKNEMEMYLGGNVFGPVVPTMEMPGLPFTFKSSADVFAALDGDMGEYIKGEMLAKGIYTFRRWFDNGFHQLTARTKPIRTADDLGRPEDPHARPDDDGGLLRDAGRQADEIPAQPALRSPEESRPSTRKPTRSA